MSDAERIQALENAALSLARALDGLHEIIAKLETRVKELEAQRDAK